MQVDEIAPIANPINSRTVLSVVDDSLVSAVELVRHGYMERRACQLLAIPFPPAPTPIVASAKLSPTLRSFNLPHTALLFYTPLSRPAPNGQYLRTKITTEKGRRLRRINYTFCV